MQALSSLRDVRGKCGDGHALQRAVWLFRHFTDPLTKEQPVALPNHGRHKVCQTSTCQMRVIPQPTPPHTFGDNVDDDRILVVSAELDLEEPLQPNLKPKIGRASCRERV